MDTKNDCNRILLVDDEEQVLFVVSESLKKLSNHCEIVTVQDGYQALALHEDSPFDLVITDVKMPGMDGIQLTKAIHAITPQVTVIWMTGFGNEAIRNEARRLGVQYFLSKPLDIADIRQIARKALATTQRQQQPRDIPSPASSPDNALQTRMQRLHNDTGAYAVLLITATGNPIEIVGATQDLDVAALSALIAGNFLAAHEIAKMLGREGSFKVSYHESEQHNIYAYGIGKDYLLVTVFGSGTRTGVVWFYAQQAANDLEHIISTMDIDSALDNTLSHLFTQEVEHELSDLLAAVWGTPAKPPTTSPPASDSAPTTHNKTTPSPQQPPSPDTLLTFEEAVAQGIIPKKNIEKDT